MKFILEVKNTTSNKIWVNFRWNFFFPSTQTQNRFCALFGKNFFISNIPRSPMCPCGLICSSVVVIEHSEEKPEGNCSYRCFFFDFSKKGIFKGYFGLFFDREEPSKKNFLHYKPCPLPSLSSRKSWEIFASAIEKIEFLFFWYFSKKWYLNTGFGIFWARNHTKHSWKQHISNLLDQGFRLVCKLSYLDIKKISIFFL